MEGWERRGYGQIVVDGSFAGLEPMEGDCSDLKVLSVFVGQWKCGPLRSRSSVS
jgi:hypothetical protein